MSLPSPGESSSRSADLSDKSQKKRRRTPVVTKEIRAPADPHTTSFVLVIDDHPDTAFMIQRALRRRSIESTCAFSAADGLTAARAHKPSLIILDEMMPDENGLDMFRKLHTDPDLCDIPVMFYSAAFEWTKQQEAESMGARAWIVKGTVKMDDFLDLIQKNAANG
jgi:CheY-like chemotaxis protein